MNQKNKSTLIWTLIVIGVLIFLPSLTHSTTTTFSISDWFIGIMTGLGLYGWISGNTGIVWAVVIILIVVVFFTLFRRK